MNREYDEDYMTLYHRTTPEIANIIKKTNKWVSKHNLNEIYFSNRPYGQSEGYGEDYVEVRIPERYTNLDDEFPDGEKHYYVLIEDLIEHGVIE